MALFTALVYGVSDRRHDKPRDDEDARMGDPVHPIGGHSDEKIAEILLNQALEQSHIKLSDINLIAYSNAPGLAPCLLKGRNFARELAEKLNIPLVPVNHCIAHLEIGELTKVPLVKSTAALAG